MISDQHECYPTQSNNFIYTLSHEARIDAAMNVWGDSLLRVAYTYMGSIADAEDIFQEVFIKLYTTQTVFKSDNHLKA